MLGLHSSAFGRVKADLVCALCVCVDIHHQGHGCHHPLCYASDHCCGDCAISAGKFGVRSTSDMKLCALSKATFLALGSILVNFVSAKS